jgi:hypothetical protein
MHTDTYDELDSRFSQFCEGAKKFYILSTGKISLYN